MSRFHRNSLKLWNRIEPYSALMSSSGQVGRAGVAEVCRPVLCLWDDSRMIPVRVGRKGYDGCYKQWDDDLCHDFHSDLLLLSRVEGCSLVSLCFISLSASEFFPNMTPAGFSRYRSAPETAEVSDVSLPSRAPAGHAGNNILNGIRPRECHAFIRMDSELLNRLLCSLGLAPYTV